MTDFIREIVSENKIRYRQDGYDLDLTYITPNIIAMGYPSKNLEGVYRNRVDDVSRFLEERHSGHYLVINLCSEKAYKPEKFYGSTTTFPIDDHGPPPFRMFLPFCRLVDEWLSRNPRNVVAVHCKAGKDRTGTMIAAFFLYKGIVRRAEDAIHLFAVQRTYDLQVLIPSQRRYVKYFELFLSRSYRPSFAPESSYQPITLELTAIGVSPIPTKCGFILESDLCFTVQSSGVQNYTSEGSKSAVYRNDTGGQLVMAPRKPVVCSEDVKIVIYKRTLLLGKEELLRFWFNTFFIQTIDQPFQQQILSTGGGFNSRLTTSSGACTSCQSNQQYLSDGPNGSFVSVVRMSNTGQNRPRVSSRSRCGCGGAGGHHGRAGDHRGSAGGHDGRLQKTLTLQRNEMEGGEHVGPENLTVTLFFNEA